MNISAANTEKLNKFKQTFTKDKIEDFFGGYKQAIQFFELQLSLLKIDQKDVIKAINKSSMITFGINKLIQSNQGIKQAYKKFEVEIQAELNSQIEFMQSQIDFLKNQSK